jgi:predicted adenine nucleotide alpha hydrolase (AANH) superfamily ATPase
MVPALFLHSCCAPCSSYVLEYLSEYFSITDFYYNPNITPQAEFSKRESELKRLIEEQPHHNKVNFIHGKYEPEVFFEMAKGMESEPEGGKRCEACYRLRLFETAKKAKELGFEFFATTLTISPLKSADVLNRIGKEAEKATGVIYIESDFKKKGGYARSIELSREYGLYRQNFCGCVFSKRQEINETTQKY